MIVRRRAAANLPPWLLRQRSPQSLRAQSVLPPQARGIIIQRRFLLGPIFRAGKSVFSVTLGATAGSAAYVNYKLHQASASTSDAISSAKDWAHSVWERLPQLPDLSDPSGGQASDASGSGSGRGGGSDGVNGQTSASGNNGDSGGGQPPPPPPAGQEAVIPLVGVLDEGNNEEESNTDQQIINLTKKMIEIRNLLTQIDGSDVAGMPSIVVIGSQSSGKTSVLETIVGHEFLPKGNNMVTRRPVELTLVHTPGSASEYCEFPALRQTRITDFSHVRRTLTDMNLNVPAEMVVSDEPIQLRVYSPNVPDLTLIDLPGYIQVVAADQPIELKERIHDLCERYIRAPNVILAVSAADVDLANSAALNASRRTDPHGERTIGVITKMDLVDPARGRALLLNREYPLAMGYVGVITRGASGLESQYFSDPTFRGLSVGVNTLKHKLVGVLEKSMASSLAPTIRAIRRELEEAAYKFKVEYNDRYLTAQTYLARSADAFKVEFQEMSGQFGRDQVRDLIKRDLEQRVLELLAEDYWNPPPGASGAETSETVALEFGNMDRTKPDMLAWQQRLDDASAALTKAGIGRQTAQLLVDAVKERMHALISKTAFRNHPTAIEVVDDATDVLLSQRYFSTADQVENSIKPYKYEVDVDSKEWARSREHSYNLLREELRQAEAALGRLEADMGSSKLSRLMKSVDRNETVDLSHFSNSVLQKARLGIFLRDRCALLRARIAFVRSSKCASHKNKALCPEVFMDVVSDKLTAASVLFLNFELLSDFYYSFPRELDSRLQALSEEDVETMAAQDPHVRRHIQLQRRRELLRLALSKLQTVSAMREGR